MEVKQQPPYPLRMPDELRTELESEAAAVHRSLNAHIVAMLQDRHGATDVVAEAEEFMRRAAQRVAKLEARAIPADVAEMLDRICERDGLALEDALRKAVVALAYGPGSVVYVRPHPGMTLAETRAMWDAARTVVSPDAHVIYDNVPPSFGERSVPPPGTTVRGKLVAGDKPAKKAKAPHAVASINKVLSMGNYETGRQLHLETLISKRDPLKPGQHDQAPGDIVPPGRDVGSQHRPASPPKPPRKISSKRK